MVARGGAASERGGEDQPTVVQGERVVERLGVGQHLVAQERHGLLNAAQPRERVCALAAHRGALDRVAQPLKARDDLFSEEPLCLVVLPRQGMELRALAC